MEGYLYLATPPPTFISHGSKQVSGLHHFKEDRKGHCVISSDMSHPASALVTVRNVKGQVGIFRVACEWALEENGALMSLVTCLHSLLPDVAYLHKGLQKGRHHDRKPGTV